MVFGIQEKGAPVEHLSDGQKSRDILVEKSDDSREQIRLYIRLTYLVPELQEFVDKGQMKMRPAVELSYLDEETQRDIVDRIEKGEMTDKSSVIYAHLDYTSKLSSAQAMESGLQLPETGGFTSRWSGETSN